MLVELSSKSDPERASLNALLFESNPLPCFIIDTETLSIKDANDAAIGFYGYSRSAFRDMALTDLQQDKQSFIPLKNWELNKKTGIAKQVSFHQKKGGELVIAELYSNHSLQDVATLCQLSVVDITNNLSVQEALEADKERYKVFIEQSSEGIFRQELTRPMPVHLSFDEMLEHIKDTCIIAECNVAMARMYGYESPADLLGVTVAQLLDLSDPANIDYLKWFVVNGFKVTDAESHERDKNGQSRYFLNNAIGIVEDGYLLRIWGTQRDITERKKIEEKIQLLANLVEETSDVLTAADLDFIPITWNKASEEIYGITAAQAIGVNIRRYVDIRYHNLSREEVRTILKEKGEWRGETYFKHALTGKDVTLLSTFKLLRDERGEPIGYVIAGTDITERKAHESRVQESEQRFRAMADSAPVMIWMTDQYNKLTYMNRPMLQYTGIDLATHNDLTWASLLHPADLEKSVAHFKQAFERHQPVTLIYQLRNAAGEFRWMQDSGTPRFLEDGTFVGYIGSIVEIHDTKLKEEKLQYEATVLQNVLDIVVTTDLDFKVRTWNRHAQDVYGLTEEEMLGKKMSAELHFEFLTDSLQDIYESLQNKGNWSGEIGFTNKEGIKKYFKHTVTYIYNDAGQKIGTLTVGRDISDKKSAEQKLQQSETFYRTLISDSLDGMLLVNPLGSITFVSPSIKHILCYEPEEIMGRNAFDFVHPDDYGWALQSLEKEVQQNPEFKSIVIRLLKKDGTWLWCMVRGHNLLSNPYVQSVAIYFHDDTLRKKASDALKESEQRFRNLIRDLQVGVLLQDGDGNIIMSNNAMYKMWDVTEQELVGGKIWELFSDAVKEDGTPLQKEERPSYRAIHTKALVRDVVMGVMHPVQKKRIWMLLNADPILNEEGMVQTIVCSFTDITERKKLEQKALNDKIRQQKALTQATIDGQEKERREIGKELHDNIGQQLTTTKLFLDLAKSAANEEAQEMINMALRSVSDLINEVRGISRSLTPPTLGDLGLIDSIYDLIETIQRTQTFVIDLEVLYFSERSVPENKKLMLFRIIQEQVNNIIKHAGANEVVITLNNEEGPILLEIKDNGKGFDPFQTRQGLGLTNIKNRAELFGGTMTLDTANGMGCTLQVNVPA